MVMLFKLKCLVPRRRELLYLEEVAGIAELCSITIEENVRLRRTLMLDIKRMVMPTHKIRRSLYML